MASGIYTKHFCIWQKCTFTLCNAHNTVQKLFEIMEISWNIYSLHDTVENLTNCAWLCKVLWFLVEQYCSFENHATFHDHCSLVTISTVARRGGVYEKWWISVPWSGMMAWNSQSALLYLRSDSTTVPLAAAKLCGLGDAFKKGLQKVSFLGLLKRDYSILRNLLWMHQVRAVVQIEPPEGES